MIVTDRKVDPTEHRRSEFFNDYERPQNKVHNIGVLLAKDGEAHLYFGVQRGRRAGSFSADDEAFVRRIAPHLQRAVQVRRLMGEAFDSRRASETALNELRLGVILLDATGKPCFINSEAEELTRVFGVKLGAAGLALPARADDGMLRSMIARAIGGDEPRIAVGSEMVVNTPTGMLQIRVCPISQSANRVFSWSTGARTIVLLVRPGPIRVSWRQTAAQWRLTRAEAILATRLAEGLTVQEAAEQLGISANTARSQLKAVFAKVGVQRQSQLVALILTSLAASGRVAPR